MVGDQAARRPHIFRSIFSRLIGDLQEAVHGTTPQPANVCIDSLRPISNRLAEISKRGEVGEISRPLVCRLRGTRPIGDIPNR